jgi:hypothetical protein
MRTDRAIDSRAMQVWCSVKPGIDFESWKIDPNHRFLLANRKAAEVNSAKPYSIPKYPEVSREIHISL